MTRHLANRYELCVSIAISGPFPGPKVHYIDVYVINLSIKVNDISRTVTTCIIYSLSVTCFFHEYAY